MRDLTPRQQEILALIGRHISETGFPPTRAEIADALGFRSVNAAEEHLKALARKGVIELSSGTSRGIRLKWLPETEPHGSGNGSGSAERFGGPVGLPGSAGLAGSVGSSMGRAVQIALSLPLIGRVAAGSPLLAQEHIESSFALDPKLFHEKPDYLLRVRGLSMRDAGILDGDLLAVRQARQARNGQVVVARLDSEVTVKRFRQRGHQIDLLPENPDFQVIRVDARNPDFVLEGIAVGLVREGRSL